MQRNYLVKNVFTSPLTGFTFFKCKTAPQVWKMKAEKLRWFTIYSCVKHFACVKVIDIVWQNSTSQPFSAYSPFLFVRTWWVNIYTLHMFVE